MQFSALNPSLQNGVGARTLSVMKNAFESGLVGAGWWGRICGLALGCVATGPAGLAVPVKIVPAPAGGWSLTRNGAPYTVRGVGGDGRLELLRELGGTTIRTWGVEQLDRKIEGRTLLDRCQDLGITVMAGIWVQHERHGFDYSDPVQLRRQRDEVRAAVRKFKDHPAILVWGLGNEMEGPSADGRDPRIWRELEELARIVKEEDPDHPVCTVIAGAAAGKVQALMHDYPSIDILGVNAYAGAAGVGAALVQAGWTKPFILAEYGPVGHWEVRQTGWGAPIEAPAREKAENYRKAYRGAMEESRGLCVGSFAFVWGQKQEVTATWYGMFLATGEKLPAVDAVAHAWMGVWPASRSPSIERLAADFAEGVVKPGASLRVEARVADADGDALTFDWRVVEESSDRKEGGDHEAEPPALPECVVREEGAAVELRAPARPGAYRVFLYARDGRGGASADNFPFRVE